LVDVTPKDVTSLLRLARLVQTFLNPGTFTPRTLFQQGTSAPPLISIPSEPDLEREQKAFL
jgi:hypothetical protein